MRPKIAGQAGTIALSFLLAPLVAASPAAAATTAAPLAAAPSDCATFEVVAHRGLWGKGTGMDENTIKAYDAAAVEGFSVEIDVWRDANHVLWAFHDRDIARATGEPSRLITDMTTAEVRELRYLKHDSPLVTLDEALAGLADYPDTRIYLEPKARYLADDVADAVVAGGRTATGYLTDYAGEVRASHPQIRELRKVVGALPSRPRSLRRQGVDIVAGGAGRLEPGLTARYQRLGIEVQGRNTNSTRAWRRTIKAGADGQLTDLPRELKAFCPVALKKPILRSANRLNRRTVALRGRFFTDALSVRIADRQVRFAVRSPRRITATFKRPGLRRATVYVRTPNGSTQRTLRLR